MIRALEDLILKGVIKVSSLASESYKKFNSYLLILSPVLEFLEFAQGQEDCRTKWLAAEKELQVMQSRINDAKKETSKLELLNHHVTMLLKDEVRVRSSLQEDIRQFVSCILIGL